jgi:Family of unknown function (DUF6326)
MKKVLDEQKVSVRAKLAALWTSFMFLYIYVDYFHLYMPGTLKDILEGKVFKFEISQAFLIAALISVSIPAIMISFSATLPAKLCRWTNLIIASLFIPYTLFNLVGDAWPHMFYGAAVEVALLMFIIRYTWKWPTVKK